MRKISITPMPRITGIRLCPIAERTRTGRGRDARCKPRENECWLIPSPWHWKSGGTFPIMRGFTRFLIVAVCDLLIAVIVTSDGVTREFPGKMRSLALNSASGYLTVSLYRLGTARTALVHQLVLEAFVGPRPDGYVCRHLDGRRTNNYLDNLAWGTPSENMQDKRVHGTDPRHAMTTCSHGHPYAGRNFNHRRFAIHGKRQCIACVRANKYIRYWNLPASDFQGIADKYYESIMSED